MESELHKSFLELSNFFNSHYNELRTKKKRGVLIFPPGESQAVGRLIFNHLESEGIATFIVSGRNLWNPKDPYYESQRDAALRGCKITRIFLIPHRRFIREPLLLEHSKLDQLAGIKIKFVDAKKLISRRGVIAPPYTLDFGIWDKSFVCFVDYQNYSGNIVPHEWRISIRPEDLEFALSLINDILGNKDLIIDPNVREPELDLEEPMLKSAPLMSMLSEVMCKGSQVCAEDCSWYHGIWQYLRIFDLVSTPTWHYKFYIESLKSLFKGGEIKVLISGTADYSMLAHVLYAFSDTETKHEITVLDLCKTSLFMCEWCAIQEGEKIKTLQQDVLEFDKDGYFDLIITDAFLTRFSDDEKLQILNRWHSLLKDDGIIITTARMEWADRPVKALETEILEFTEKVLRSAQSWRPFLPEPIEDIKFKSQEYAKRMSSVPVKDKKFLRDLVTKSGFSIITDEIAKVKGEMHETYYIRLIAKKKDRSTQNQENNSTHSDEYTEK